MPILEDLAATLPDLRELARILSRLVAALAVGALVGYQRERVGKAAGLRTHMLVALGTALLVISALESGMGEDAVSRVIQGLVTGISLIGGVLTWMVLGVFSRFSPDPKAGPAHGNG